MDTQPSRSPDAASTDADVSPPTFSEPAPAHPEEGLSEGEAGPEQGRRDPSRDEVDRRSTTEPAEPKRIGWLEGHLPDLVDPLTPKHPETALTETRRLRHDGWTPEKKRRFLELFAECGVIVEACEAVGMSARSAYNLRDRDPLFAAGMEAAQVMARPKLADQAYSRSLNGVVERIYKDGMIVAERHRYDNRLTMAVLNRLDQRIDRAEAQGAPHLALVARWDDYLAALEEDRQEDARALLAGPAAGEVHENARQVVNFMNFASRRSRRPSAISTTSGRTRMSPAAGGPIIRRRPIMTARRKAIMATSPIAAPCPAPSRR